MTFGIAVAVSGGNPQKVLSGEVMGYASTTKAELVGLLATLLISPRNVEIDIKIDNMAVVSNFAKIVKGRATATVRQRLRTPYAQWWAAIHQAYVEQGCKAKVHWIRGHNGDAGNEQVGQIARHAHYLDPGRWDICMEDYTGLRCHASFKGEAEEDDVRTPLRIQSAARVHQK